MTRKNKTVSNEMRETIINMYLNGGKASTIANLLNINRTTAAAIIKKFLNTDKLHSERIKNKKKSKLSEEQKNELRSWVDEDCSLSLRVLATKVREFFNINISKSTVDRILKRFHYSVKRINFLPVRRNDSENISRRKEYAIDYIRSQSLYSENNYIFIDETGFNVSMRTSMGRSQVGTPAVMTIPALRSRNISVCCAINNSEILYYKSQSRAFNGAFFYEWISELIIIL